MSGTKKAGFCVTFMCLGLVTTIAGLGAMAKTKNIRDMTDKSANLWVWVFTSLYYL